MIHQARQRCTQKRYALIAELLRLEVLFSGGIPYTPFGFEQAMQYMDQCENDLIEAKIHAFNKQLDYQEEAHAVPVRESFDELAYLLAINKITA